MKKQIQGIALILFGILIMIFGEILGSVFFADLDFIFGILGILSGIVGLVFVFKKSNDDNTR